MKTFKEIHRSFRKGDELYQASLLKALDESDTEKEFLKLAAGFTGRSKISLKKCSKCQKILEDVQKRVDRLKKL